MCYKIYISPLICFHAACAAGICGIGTLMLTVLAFFYHWWMVLLAPFIGIPLFLVTFQIWDRAKPSGGRVMWTGLSRILIIGALFLIYGTQIVTIALTAIGVAASTGVPNPMEWGSDAFPPYAAVFMMAALYLVSAAVMTSVTSIVNHHIVTPFFR